MLKTFYLWLASGLGSGYLPLMPGTWGSFFALIPIYFILHSTHPAAYLLLFVFICSVVNILTAPTAEKYWGEDPPKMVVDEWAGQGITFVGVLPSVYALSDFYIILFGFILFRFFDMVKPLGIYKIQNLRGGCGILADDLLAGFYACMILHVILFLGFGNPTA